MNLDFMFLKNLNILYVEDDPVIGTQTVALLKNFFHIVFYVDNAEEALTIFKSENVHILITDIRLPGISGLQLCEEVRKINRQLPIFITTMYDDKEKLQQAVKLNLVDYLIKPVSIQTIRKTLTESLKRIEESDVLVIHINSKTLYYPLLGELKVDGKSIGMTNKEIKLLDLLLKHKNKVVSKETIEQLVSGDETLTDAGYKNLIYRLRRKIEKNSIVSLSGVGIKLKIENT